MTSLTRPSRQITPATSEIPDHTGRNGHGPSDWAGREVRNAVPRAPDASAEALGRRKKGTLRSSEPKSTARRPKTSTRNATETDRRPRYPLAEQKIGPKSRRNGQTRAQAGIGAVASAPFGYSPPLGPEKRPFFSPNVRYGLCRDDGRPSCRLRKARNGSNGHVAQQSRQRVAAAPAAPREEHGGDGQGDEEEKGGEKDEGKKKVRHRQRRRRRRIPLATPQPNEKVTKSCADFGQVSRLAETFWGFWAILLDGAVGFTHLFTLCSPRASPSSCGPHGVFLLQEGQGEPDQ